MSYARVADHATMVFDRVRNEAYGRALQSCTGPGSVVLDLGAGMGLHGLMAAAAGAERVYLVDPQPVVQLAAEVARRAGLRDRIVIIQKRIEDVALPEPVDTIVSVLTGNLLYSEDLLPSLFHARDRYLKPAGQLVPRAAELWLAPLEAGELHHQHVARWSEPIMGMDYAAARKLAANQFIWPRVDQWASTRRLSGGAAAVTLDLRVAGSADCNGQATCIATGDGVCHGLLAWLRLETHPGEWISSAPGAPALHWSPALLPIDPPLALRSGEEIHIDIIRPAFGDWTWRIAAETGTRRHSSFLAASEGARELARTAPGARPGLSARGVAAMQILRALDDGLSIQQAADRLAVAGAHGSAKDLRDAQALASRYGGDPS